MTKRDVLKLLAAGLPTAALLGCGGMPVTYRYRMTVEVDTPRGLRTGSSVIEVVTSHTSGLSGSSFANRIKGEAVAVDLPGGTLFALLSNREALDAAAGYAPTAYHDVLPDQGKVGADWFDVVHALKKQSEPAVLQASYYPTLVRFRDIRDPKSVEAVDPGYLVASFGPGVSLRLITVTITDDEVTEEIEKRLPWWSEYKDKQLDGHSYNDSTDFANGMNRQNFKQED